MSLRYVHLLDLRLACRSKAQRFDHQSGLDQGALSQWLELVGALYLASIASEPLALRGLSTV